KTATLFLLQYFVDNVLGAKAINLQVLPAIAAAFVVLALIEGGFTFYSGKLAAITAERIAQRLRNYLFDHIQRLTFTYHDENKTGDLIQRSTSDVDAVRGFFLEQAIGVGRIVILFVINLIAVLALHWQLGLASIVTVPLILVVSVFF